MTAPTWDPEQYLRYADERGRPFADLLARVGAVAPAYVVDLGCGPGTLTRTLVERWPGAEVVGVDSSAEMIARARVDGAGVSFVKADLREWRPAWHVDVLVSISAHLGISISVHVIRDAHHPELARRLALSGRLGEVRYSDDLHLAVVLVPESLPPLVFDLTVFHELGHLAAGDLLTLQRPEETTALPEASDSAGLLPTTPVRHGQRLARELPFATESAREHEANLRASYAFVAGCLGAENPYVHGMYQVL